MAGSKASVRSISPGGSVVAFSDRLSLASGSLPGIAQETTLSPQALGVMGMEALETVINFWEDALTAYQATTFEESEFQREIQSLLDIAWQLQDQSELLFLDQRSVLFREESVASARRQALERSMSDPNFDSAESFASALDQVKIYKNIFNLFKYLRQEIIKKNVAIHSNYGFFLFEKKKKIADIREFEDFADTLPDYEDYPLYQNAIKHLEETVIPVRMMRTEMVNCSSDLEYLAKLHCIRLGFQYLFKVNNNQRKDVFLWAVGKYPKFRVYRTSHFFYLVGVYCLVYFQSFFL